MGGQRSLARQAHCWQPLSLQPWFRVHKCRFERCLDIFLPQPLDPRCPLPCPPAWLPILQRAKQRWCPQGVQARQELDLVQQDSGGIWLDRLWQWWHWLGASA